MTTKTNLISHRDLNVLPASVSMPHGIRHAAWEDVLNGGLDMAQKNSFVPLPIGAGKTVAAARWLLARCGRADVRCA